MTPRSTTAYDTALFEDNFPEGVESHFWFRARNRIIDGALREAEAGGFLPPRPRILEVGCGTGIVVSAMLAKGHDVSGVEIGRPPIRPQLRSKITVATAAADLPAPMRATFDGLMFLDVIEHVPDDVALLRETLAAFPNCRCVVITVPARPEVWSRHDTHYGHFRRYTRPSLRTSLEAAGLKPIRVRYAFRSLYAAAALMKLARRDRDPVMTPPKSPWLQEAVAAVLLAETAILQGLPVPGLSLVATAQIKSARH